MMIQFLLFVFIGSLLINGWYEITRNGKAFGFWQRYWEWYIMKENPDEDYPLYRFPEWIRSPISECIMCMSSVYGSLIFWITFILFNHAEFFKHSSLQLVAMWIAYCISLVSFNYIIHKQLK